MTDAIGLFLGAILRLFRARHTLLLENLALRQQLAALKRKHPRPKLAAFDKLFWVLARRFWSGWNQALIIVSPETVVRWHRSGFALYWRAISRARRIVGRRGISREVRDLIFRMVTENPTWGAPRIHGELLMLGFDVSDRTISRWMRRAPRDPEPARRWLSFLRNHREAIAAMDFFTVPTITFGVLYCFFIIGHDRRRILHFNVTPHPSSAWIGQQLREAFPDGVAERWIESCRRDLLDHVIAGSERHLKRLLSDYVRYYHEDRTHLGLNKETPAGRVRSTDRGVVVSRARLGGLHHRYDRAA
jgi:putative transposase